MGYETHTRAKFFARLPILVIFSAEIVTALSDRLPEKDLIYIN